MKKIAVFLMLAAATAYAETAFAPKTDLKRVMVGNQAGLIKVLGPGRKGVAFTRGIDDRSLARYDAAGRDGLFEALGLNEHNLTTAAQSVLKEYPKLPAKEAVAVLGVMGTSQHLEPKTKLDLHGFFLNVMQNSKDVAARRQAILALAVQPEFHPETVEKVLQHYEKTDNLWETFPVQQFFEYHAEDVRKMSNFEEVRRRVAAVNSLYTNNVLNYLDMPKTEP